MAQQTHVIWAKELSNLVSSLIEVTQITFLNRLKRMSDESSRDNIRGAERSIQLTNIKKFIQVTDSLVYIQVAWNQFCMKSSSDSSEMVNFSGQNNIHNIVNIVVHMLKSISDENIPIFIELPGLETFFRHWCTDAMWIKLKNSGVLQIMFKKMVALVAKCTTLNLSNDSGVTTTKTQAVPRYLQEMWKSLWRLVKLDTNYRILKNETNDGKNKTENIDSEDRTWTGKLSKMFNYRDSETSGNIQNVNCIDDYDREFLLQTLFPIIEHKTNKNTNAVKACEIQNHYNWCNSLTTLSVQMVTSCLLTYTHSGSKSIRESINELSKKHNNSPQYSEKCKISNCDMKFQLLGEDVHKELVNWLNSNNLIVLIILDWNKNWPGFTKNWVFNLVKELLGFLNQYDVTSKREDEHVDSSANFSKKRDESGTFDGFLDFGNKFYNIQQSMMFKSLITTFQLTIIAYQSHFEKKHWAELSAILEDLLVKLSQRMDSVTLQFIEFCSLAPLPFSKQILPKMYRLLNGTYFSFSDRTELYHCDSLQVQKLRIVLEQGFSIKQWTMQSVYSEYLNVYKNNKSSILKWSNNDAGGTGGTSEAMSNKLLKLLGGNKTGSKAGSKTANLGGNKSNKTAGLMNVNLGKSLGVGGSSLGSGNALSELSHTASD